MLKVQLKCSSLAVPALQAAGARGGPRRGQTGLLGCWPPTERPGWVGVIYGAIDPSQDKKSPCCPAWPAAADKTVFRVNAAMLYYTTLLVHYIKILTTAATSLAQDRMEQTVSAGSLLISYDYSDQQRYYGTCNNTHSNVLNLIIH